MSRDLDLAIQAAKQAGQLIRDGYGKVKDIQKKGAGDFVTEIDREAEVKIISQLQQTGYSVLGEESGETDNQTKKKWVIDPIDGTTNFIRGLSLFAVSIALIEENKNLILGVVYDPIADECYAAEKNQGAYLNGKKINVSNKDRFDDSLILIDHGRSTQHRSTYVKALREIKPVVYTRTLGTTALMLAYVAKGAAEAFLSYGDNLYDYAAGLIITQEAGAIVTDWKGQPWDNSNSYVLVSNPQMLDKIVNKISKLQE